MWAKTALYVVRDGQKTSFAVELEARPCYSPVATSRPFASTLTLSLVLSKYERSNKRFETFNVTHRSTPLNPKGLCQEAFDQPEVSPAKSQAGRSSKDGAAEDWQTQTNS